MKESTRNIALIAGGFVALVTCGCAGLVGFAYFEITSCVGDLNEPVETVGTSFDCGASTITVVNIRTTTNWLEGVHRNEAFLRVDDGDRVDVPVSHGRFRGWIPERHLPPHRIDGAASAEGFEVFLDPAVVPSSVAGAVEGCLIGKRDQLADALHDTNAHRYSVEEEETVVYWRAAPETLEPIFTAPNGDTVQLTSSGGLWYEATHGTATSGSLSGQVTRQPDGSLRVAVELETWGAPATTPVADFRTPDGDDLEAWFGVPITPEFDQMTGM